MVCDMCGMGMDDWSVAIERRGTKKRDVVFCKVCGGNLLDAERKIDEGKKELEPFHKLVREV